MSERRFFKEALDLLAGRDATDYTKAGYRGCVVTYAQLAVGAGCDLMRRATRVPTLAILDEIHHAGDNRSWGDGLRQAVEQARMRLALTGTPWRRDTQSPIPFVRYDNDGMVVVDYAYEYGAAVADGVCRRIEFHAYDGEAKWTDCGVVSQSRLGAQLLEEDISTVLDGVYHPNHQWMPVLLARADEALTEVRREVPDAGGLVCAERQWQAQAYAALLKEITGEDPMVVVSDDPDAKAAIDRFRDSKTCRWIIAVKMVSEGVDIPRLAVGVYASKTRTPLFFRQVVGRFVRTRPDEELNARLFIPAVPALMEHARQIEEELRHQLDIEVERDSERAPREGEQQPFQLRELVSAGGAAFDRAIVGGEEVSPAEVALAEAKARELKIPAKFALNLLPLLRQNAIPAPVAIAATSQPRHRLEKMLRSEVETLARKYAYRAHIEPREVNYRLRQAGHPARARASIEDLEKMLDTLAQWHGGQ